MPTETYKPEWVRSFKMKDKDGEHEVVVVVPRINLNGTAPETLIRNYLNAINLLTRVHEAIFEVAPHGRDYQTYADPRAALEAATSQHEHWKAQLQMLKNEIWEVASQVHDQDSRRKRAGG